MSRPIFFAFFVVTLDAMGAGLIYPVLPELLAKIFDMPRDSSPITLAGGILFMVFAVLMFFFGPILGNLSDRFGRQRVLFFAMAAMAVDYALMALFPLFWVLVLGRVIVGIAGGLMPLPLPLWAMFQLNKTGGRILALFPLAWALALS